MVSLFWSSQTEIFRRKRDFLKGSPKFPNGISKQKTCSPFASLQTLSVNLNELCIMVHTDLNWISHSGVFAYHFHKPSTNRFLLVNGKQPQSISPLTSKISKGIFFRYLQSNQAAVIKCPRSDRFDTIAIQIPSKTKKKKNISCDRIGFFR